MEICPKCYSEYFPVYKNMKIEVSKGEHKCHGCGKTGKVVRKVTVGGDVVDRN